MASGMPFVYHDGGRASAGFKGEARDCVTRAVAIATGLPYREVYDSLDSASLHERPRQGKQRSSARTGVWKQTLRRFMEERDWLWTPTMSIGSGCTVHLRSGELPMGRLLVSVSRHVVAVIDGVVMDTYDPTRDGTRCVYGYYAKD